MIDFYIRNCSHITTHLVVLLVGSTVFKKAEGSDVSDQIGMKSGRTVHHINAHRLTGVGFPI